MSELINFTHIQEELNFFPFNCWNGYYFLYNTRLTATPLEELPADPKKLIKQELGRLKKKKS